MDQSIKYILDLMLYLYPNHSILLALGMVDILRHHEHIVGPQIIELRWAKKRVFLWALRALDHPLVVQTKN